MGKFSYEKKVSVFHGIYEQLFNESSISNSYIAKNIGIHRCTVGNYLSDMYDDSIIFGPVISLKPAKNYHQYAYFLKFENPFSVSNNLREIPGVIYLSVGVGPWNVFIISEKKMDFSKLLGFKQDFFQGVKGTTHFSTVTSLDWDTSLETMYNTIDQPFKKIRSTLYHECPNNPWKERGWTLYNALKKNIHAKKKPIREKYRIGYYVFKEWLLALPEYTKVQPAFYPHKVDSYFAVDFLFESEYHTQLKTILGMLPSTGIFFSVGTYLLARLFFLTKKEQNELLTFILQLKEKKYYTRVFNAIKISGSQTENEIII